MFTKSRKFKIIFTIESFGDVIEGVAKIPANTLEKAKYKFRREFGTRYKVTEVTEI
jgi:hypothetical protein